MDAKYSRSQACRWSDQSATSMLSAALHAATLASSCARQCPRWPVAVATCGLHSVVATCLQRKGTLKNRTGW
eukprot:5928842-Alexandrium_andersonii.AAC.2